MKVIHFFLFLILSLPILCQKGGATTQAENRNSGRSNSDKGGRPNRMIVSSENGKSTEIELKLFRGIMINGFIEVYASSMQGKPLDLSKAISFSKDDKILYVNKSKFCPPHCDEGDLLLEFRASGKSDIIQISNLKSWPPKIATIQGKQN